MSQRQTGRPHPSRRDVLRRAALRRIDVLGNNTEIITAAPLADMPVPMWDEMTAANLRSEAVRNKVNAICPGAVTTELGGDIPPELRAQRLAEIPLGQFGAVGEIVSTAAMSWSDTDGLVERPPSAYGMGRGGWVQPISNRIWLNQCCRGPSQHP